ncbi:MAG: YitT family protein [Ruminococcaceae bacterium]|nr:YitT family protein [Oscillospiraceae bacterium]
MKLTTFIKEYSLIVIGTMLYAITTVLFIFPNSLLLGGISGISLILASFIPQTPGIISIVINVALIILAFAVLGRDMAIKTLVGSALTSVFIGIFEPILTFESPLIANSYVSAIIGATVIAVASGIMFYVDSSSGGTDIIALIIKKFSNINIGVALLISDVLIVITGGLLDGFEIFLPSTVGFLIKTLGVDAVIYFIRRMSLSAVKKKNSI